MVCAFFYACFEFFKFFKLFKRERNTFFESLFPERERERKKKSVKKVIQVSSFKLERSAVSSALGMGAELDSELATLENIADNMAAAKRNDDEAADMENDAMAAAKQEDDEAKDKRNDITKKEDTTAARYNQGTTEMKTEGGWGFPFAM